MIGDIIIGAIVILAVVLLVRQQIQLLKDYIQEERAIERRLRRGR